MYIYHIFHFIYIYITIYLSLMDFSVVASLGLLEIVYISFVNIPIHLCIHSTLLDASKDFTRVTETIFMFIIST